MKFINEWEQGVVFRLGKFKKSVGPGFTFFIPVIDRLEVVDTRLQSFEMPEKQIETSDQERMFVKAEVHYRVTDVVKAKTNVADYHSAFIDLSDKSLHSFAVRFTKRDWDARTVDLSEAYQEQLNRDADIWGLSIESLLFEIVLN